MGAATVKILITMCLTVTLVACTLTQQAAVKGSSRSGLLDDSKLRAGGEGQADQRYVNKTVLWSKYRKILIEPVAFWEDDGSVSREDQLALCNYFHRALREQFGERFELVDGPGPGVMRLQVALVDAEAATPVLRTVSMLVPQAHVLATLKYIGTGTYPFIGGAQVEAKLTDSRTGKLLGEWIDRRVGGGSFAAGLQWRWGDAEHAIDQWAADAADRLGSWTSASSRP